MRKYLFLCFLGLTWAKSQYPSTYLEEDSSIQVRDEATVELDTVSENCEDDKFEGYECVPYYQCHNGTIVIDDGAGLIDVRPGFPDPAALAIKCPGLLDVCCKDPDFIPPPPLQ